MIDFDTTLMPWIGRSMKLIDYFIADRFAQHGIDLSKVQWLLLKKLKERNGASQHNLAFLTNRDKASLTRLLTTMERKNLVARVPSKDDQRVNCIYLTSQGEKILKKTMPIVEGIIEEMQTGISIEERRAAIQTLHKIIHNINSKDIALTEKRKS